MKKVPMTMKKKNEEKKRRIVFVSSSVVVVVVIFISIELKRITLVCANFKRKTFAFSRRRATCSFVTRRSFMSAIDDSLSLSLASRSVCARFERRRQRRRERRKDFRGKERIVVERSTKNNEHKRRSLSLSFSLFLSPSRGGLNKTTKE